MLFLNVTIHTDLTYHGIFFTGAIGRCFRSLGPSCCPSPLLSQPYRKSSCEMRREGDPLLALPGPWPCSCGGILLVPPVGPGAGWPQQREHVSQVRMSCSSGGLCAGQERGQWPVHQPRRWPYLWMSQLCLLSFNGWQSSAVELWSTLPSACAVLPWLQCYRLSTLLVVQCHPHSLCNALPYSMDLFFHSVPVDQTTAINLNIIFKTSAVRWLRKGGQAEYPCSRDKRSGRNLSVDTPRDVVRRGQGSNTPVGQESGC